MNFLLKLKALFANDVLVRTAKTIVAVVLTEGSLYTTVVPNPPNTKTSAALAGGAGLITLVWNALLTWATASKAKRLNNLAAVIDAAVAAKLAERLEAQKAPGRPATLTELGIGNAQ